MPIKNWLDNGKCLLGFHQGEWHLEAKNRCDFAQVCERCNVVNRRTEHTWAEWSYTAEHECSLGRTCARCGNTEERVEHQWGDWVYQKDNACDQGIPCTRCNDWSAESRVVHEWGPWEYVEAYRAPIRACGRCELNVSCFPDQTVGRAEEVSYRGEESAAKVRELLSDDAAIEDLLKRAEQSATGDEPAKPEKDWKTDGLAELQAEYQRQIDSSGIKSERQPLLTSIMQQLGSALENTDDLEAKKISVAQIQKLMSQMSPMLMAPSRAEGESRLVSGSRQAILTDLFGDLYRYATGEVSRSILSGEEGKAAINLLGSLRPCREAIHALTTDADAFKLEVESLRQVATDIRNFSLRYHLTLAHPLWPSQRIPQNPSAVFCSAGKEVNAVLAAACQSRQLTPLFPKAHREPASFRWDQMRESVMGVFDFTAYKTPATLEEAAPVAAVAYELGICLALGRPVILVATPEQHLPFDLDIDPIRLGSGDQTAELANAMDQALYGLQRGTAGNSVEKSAAYLRTRFGAHSDFNVRVAVDSLSGEAVRDPVKASLLMASPLSFLGSESPFMLQPAWPGDYPDSANKRCFHVTAFGPAWANTAMDILSGCCPPGIEYVRGDMGEEQDILRSIWDEVCRATHIVVDLTGLNANVILELGLAHALGRKVLLVSQDSQPERYFRAIAKHRIHKYALGTDADVMAFKGVLSGFLR